MTTNIDRAAEIVDRLRLDSGPGDMSTAEHVARALADAGLLAADLPELSEGSEAGVTALGQVYIRYWVDDMHLAPAEARSLALDLLAAADHAEGVGRADS